MYVGSLFKDPQPAVVSRLEKECLCTRNNSIFIKVRISLFRRAGSTLLNVIGWVDSQTAVAEIITGGATRVWSIIAILEHNGLHIHIDQSQADVVHHFYGTNSRSNQISEFRDHPSVHRYSQPY